ncbi:competence protein ComEA [Cellulomonas sp. WB94]|uniref:helix-hairpin-helix domain-containing protein n=1 Tax=Cellulomonas sp. WB94 TaxID=2173174 RepID=UPI000D56F121|nr:helix-hairpin-helix domain-containing protein [Cellulomonas sp. WB94]PVU84261.1 competence protein ComEA [Cellulomonas sp. WB94]
MRLALTAALAMGLVGGAVALRSAAVASAGLVPIELPPVGVSLSSVAADTDDARGAASTPGAATGSASTGSASVDGTGSVSTVRTSGGAVVVHVVGEVATPGVVQLAAGSRVDDAIRAAGGATERADLAALNLARVVIDGEQVVVPAPGDAVAPQTGAPPGGGTAPDGAGSGGSSSATVDLNGADAAALDALPGIGPVLAGRIVDWRQANGRFASVDQLGEVDGIGPTLLAKLRPLVRV